MAHTFRYLYPISVALFFSIVICFLSCTKDKFSFDQSKLINLPITSDITDFAFHDSLNGYAVGGQVWGAGFVLHTTDGGHTWTKVFDAPAKIEAIALDTVTGAAFACGQAGGLYQKQQGQSSWSTITIDYQTWFQGISTIAGAKQVCIVNGEAFRFGKVISIAAPDTQMDTLLIGANELTDIIHMNDSAIMTVGYGYVLRSIDQGISWERLDMTGAFFKAIDFIGQHGLIIAEDGRVWLSTDTGATWQKTTDIKTTCTDVAWANTSKAFICGTNGSVWKTNDSGQHWVQAENLPPGQWLSVKCLGNQIYLGGKDGNMLILTDIE
jgi:photosystem II stability/assembly factor-like uncharacterized protein